MGYLCHKIVVESFSVVNDRVNVDLRIIEFKVILFDHRVIEEFKVIEFEHGVLIDFSSILVDGSVQRMLCDIDRRYGNCGESSNCYLFEHFITV